MDLKFGDHVVVIDEDLDGKVVSLNKGQVVIHCDDGFEYTYNINQLLKIGSDGEVEFVRKNFEVKEEGENLKDLNLSTHKSVQLSGKKPIIDLHIEDLAPNIQFESLHEILDFQLNHVQQVLIVAAANRIRQLVFVHGVGKGVLRDKLRTMLSSNYPTVEFFDGSYQQFGAGATELIIHQFSAIE